MLLVLPTLETSNEPASCYNCRESNLFVEYRRQNGVLPVIVSRFKGRLSDGSGIQDN